MEPLKDPLNDRTLPSLEPSPFLPLRKELIYKDISQGKEENNDEDRLNYKVIRDHLLKEGKVTKSDFRDIALRVMEMLRKEPTLLELQSPISVIGDIHGQYHDLVRMLEILESPEKESYLFLGDYVDRGKFSIEVLILLFTLKINYPDKVHFLRGNHECRELTAHFNFRVECLDKYDIEVYNLVMDVFDCLPLAAVINNRFLCLHGGIGPDLNLLQDLNSLNRFKEPPQVGLFCDLLWADPLDSPDGVINGGTFLRNGIRGCSYFYGVQACNNFLTNNKLVTIIRAHEAQIEGYKVHGWVNGNFPSVITIFSAPNYCDVYNNKAAFIQFRGNDLSIKQFYHVTHPYYLPNHMDVFSWSIPFVAEKLLDIFLNLLRLTAPSPENQDDDFTPEEEESFKKMLAQNPELQGLILQDKMVEMEPVTALNESYAAEVEGLEKALEKKKELKEESEQMIMGVDLNGSQISQDSIIELQGPDIEENQQPAPSKQLSFEVKKFGNFFNKKRTFRLCQNCGYSQ